jgi:NAD(P)-dependent dehydrogenase (short-subunit alcohol dehydrogenase family)
LINNIGIGQPFQNPDEASLSLFREQFEVNVLGPQIVTVAFLPLLRKGDKKIIMNMYILIDPFNSSSSLAGGIAYNDGRYPFKVPAYGASKAALNFLTADYAKYLAPEGFTVVPLSPGVHSFGE